MYVNIMITLLKIQCLNCKVTAEQAILPAINAVLQNHLSETVPCLLDQDVHSL